MPELPEVEHARRSLSRWLAGVTVERVETAETRVFRGKKGARRAFERALPGRHLERAERHGKIVLLFFDAGVGVLSHLGMSGKWVRCLPGETSPPHTHARLHLSDESVVCYVDPRQFGRLAVHPSAHLRTLPEVRALGPDALLEGVDPKRLHAALARTARPVKVALLDQKVLAGVGNIYATEALFRAGLHPARLGVALTRREVELLAAAIQETLADALARLGDEIDYLSEGAHVDNPFLVYDRAGDPCPRCGKPLEGAVIGGRASVWCPTCQPASRPRQGARARR